MKVLHYVFSKKLNRKNFFLLHVLTATLASIILMEILTANNQNLATPTVMTIKMIVLSMINLGSLPTTIIFLDYTSIVPSKITGILFVYIIYSLITVATILMRVRDLGYKQLDIYILFVISPFIPVLNTLASFYLFLKEGKISHHQ